MYLSAKEFVTQIQADCLPNPEEHSRQCHLPCAEPETVPTTAPSDPEMSLSLCCSQKGEVVEERRLHLAPVRDVSHFDIPSSRSNGDFARLSRAIFSSPQVTEVPC